MTATKHDADNLDAEKECRCGGTHSVEWWDGYDAGREDGFEEGCDWAAPGIGMGTWCEACNDFH